MNSDVTVDCGKTKWAITLQAKKFIKELKKISDVGRTYRKEQITIRAGNKT